MTAIDSGIPVPAKRHKWPIRELEPGQSFLIPCPPEDRRRASVSQRQIAGRIGKRLGRRFTVAQVEDGVRVWRVS